MSDDSMKWEIVFDARVGAGMETVAAVLGALERSQASLIAQGIATEETFAVTSEALGKLSAGATNAAEHVLGMETSLQRAQRALIEYGAASEESFKSVGGGSSTLEQRFRLLAEAQTALADSGMKADVKFQATSERLIKLADDAEAARAAFADYGKQLAVVGADRLQNLSGEIDAALQREIEARREASDAIRRQMESTAELQSAQERYVAFEAETYNMLLWDQERYDAKKVAAEEKAIEQMIAADDKYRAFEAETYNQLLFEQARFDAKKLESEQKTAAEQKAARESYVAFEASTYNQLLFEQERYDAKVLADQEQIWLRAKAVAGGVIYPATNRITATAEKTAAGALAPLPVTNQAALAPNIELVNLQKQLDAATKEAQAQVEALARGYRSAADSASALGRAWSPAEQTLKTQELRTKVDEVTKAYSVQVKEIEAAGMAAKGMDAAATGAGGAIRGLGNFYPLILQTAVWTKVSKDMLGFGAAAIKTAAAYQDSFASVSRTATVSGSNVSGQLAYIKKALEDLDTQMPMTFDDLSKIATMGNEMGIAANGIIGFTKTVAEYSTITGTSIENTANAIGAVGNILHLTSDQYEKLGSAISLTGRLSLASETEITGMTEKIAATAHQAGFTAQQIIGLSATLASVKEPLEKAQGALEKWFSVANTAAADGGKKLDMFAQAIHKTASETKMMIETNPNQFLQDFLKYLNSLDSAGKTKALADMGLSGTRVSETLRRLSDNLPLLTRLLGDANKGFAQGTDLQDQYSKRTATLAQHFKELQNATTNLFADLGSTPAIQNLAGIVNIIKDIVVGMGNWVQHNQGLAGLIVILTALFGLYASVRAAIFGAALMASIFSAAEARVAGATTIENLAVLARMFFGVGSAGGVGAFGMNTFAAAEDGVTLSTKILQATLTFGLSLVLTYIISLLMDFRGTMIWTAQAFSVVEPEIDVVVGLIYDLISVVEQAGVIILNTVGAITSMFGLLPNGLSNFFGGWADALQKGSDSFQKTSENIGKTVDGVQKKFLAWAKAMKDPNAVPKLEAPKANINDEAMADYQKRVAAIDAAQQKAAASASSTADGISSVGAAAQAQVYTLADYANDLSGVFKRAFDIQFGPMKAADAIVTQFQQMKDAANSARKDIETARNSINKLEADMSKTNADNANQKYFLSVAQQFGDSSRANDIQSTINQNNATLAGDHSQLLQAQTDLANGIDKLSTSFKSNSAGAIANRSALLDLYGKYQDYITALAASGASQKTLEAATKKAKEQFDAQARSLGFMPADIATVDKGFSGMITTIAKIPRNITVKANADPAMQAINEFVAHAQKQLSSLASKPVNIPAPTFSPSDNNKAIRTAIEAEMAPYIAYLKWAGNAGTVADPATIRRYDNRLAVLKQELSMYADGGYTGPGGKYQPAGIVHKGEYVVPAHQVNQSTGLPYADALGRPISGTPAQSSYASGGFVNSDMMVTELGPRSLGVLRQLVNSEVVAVISAQNLTGAVNATNSANRRRGR